MRSFKEQFEMNKKYPYAIWIIANDGAEVIYIHDAADKYKYKYYKQVKAPPGYIRIPSLNTLKPGWNTAADSTVIAPQTYDQLLARKANAKSYREMGYRKFHEEWMLENI